MTREQMVLEALKPKVKAFGFNKKELKGIAAKIADNLTSAEDASIEDLNAEIATQIEAAIPFLQFAQSQSSRVIEAAIKLNKTDEKSVIDIARLYGITFNDVQKWKLYWENKGLKI